jgi:hypothetical protein
MRANSRCGFNVIGLAVMTAVVMLLVLALIPAMSMSCGVWSANVSAVGCRGRDIYVAITSASRWGCRRSGRRRESF